MKLKNIDFEGTKFNLIPNRYQDTNAIAIMIQEVGEDYCEPLTISAKPDEDEIKEENLSEELVAIFAEDSDYAHILSDNGLIVKPEWEWADFFEGIYYYTPTKELLKYLQKLKHKYNK